MFIGSMTCVNHDENCNKLQWHRWKNHTWIVRLCGSNLQIQTQHVALHALLSTPCSPRLYSFTPHSTRDASHSIFYTPKLRTPQSMHLALHTLRPTLNIQHFPPEVQHSTLPTPHFTVQTPHYTPQSPLHLKLGTLHSILHIPHYACHTPYSTLLIFASALCTPNSTLYTPHIISALLCTPHSSLYTLHVTLQFPHSALPNPHCTCCIPTRCNPHSTLYTLHFTFYSLLLMFYTSHFALHFPPLHTNYERVEIARSPANVLRDVHLGLPVGSNFTCSSDISNISSHNFFESDEEKSCNNIYTIGMC